MSKLVVFLFYCSESCFLFDINASTYWFSYKKTNVYILYLVCLKLTSYFFIVNQNHQMFY